MECFSSWNEKNHEKKRVNDRKGKKINFWECTVPNSMFSASN